MLPCFEVSHCCAVHTWISYTAGRGGSSGTIVLLPQKFSEFPSPSSSSPWPEEEEEWSAMGSSSWVCSWAKCWDWGPKKNNNCCTWACHHQLGSSQFTVICWSSENCESETRGQDNRCESPEPKRPAFWEPSAACWVERSPWAWSSWGWMWHYFSLTNT